MNSDPPIIFMHYGDNFYLPITLKNVKEKNPTKRIILLGDKDNKKYTNLGIEHYEFTDFIDKEYEFRFDEHYRHVGGSEFYKLNLNKGGEDWTKFNFLKWRRLLNFCRTCRIQQFWTFDADVLFTTNLSGIERYFVDVDYTTVSEHKVFQGFMNNLEVLRSFSEVAIEVFKDEEYLNKLLLTDFELNPTFGLTMMRVFKLMNDREYYKSVDLRYNQLPIKYDPCVCIEYDNEEFYREKVGGHYVKQLYIGSDGLMYQDIHSDEKKEKVPFFAINMSWTPEYFIKRVSKKLDLKMKSGEFCRIDPKPTILKRIEWFLIRNAGEFLNPKRSR